MRDDCYSHARPQRDAHQSIDTEAAAGSGYAALESSDERDANLNSGPALRPVNRQTAAGKSSAATSVVVWASSLGGVQVLRTVVLYITW